MSKARPEKCSVGPHAQGKAGAPKSRETPDNASLTAGERARLLAELEAELAEAERSVAEEGVVTAEEFEQRMDALMTRLAREAEHERRKRSGR